MNRPSRHKEAEIELRRSACIKAAEKLFHTKGFTETSMQDIAEAAGISVGSLYNMFKNKQELIREVFRFVSRDEEAWAQKIADDDTLPFREALVLFLGKMMKACRKHELLFKVMVQSFAVLLAEDTEGIKDMLRHREVMLGHLTRIIERGIKEGLIEANLDARRLAAGIAGSMIGLFAHMVIHEDGISPELTAQEICDFVLYGIGRRQRDD